MFTVSPVYNIICKKARAEGVNEDEILEAVRIGKQVERGSISNMQKKIDQLIEVKSN